MNGQLSPNEYFLIHRNLVDSASTDVNFVQAIIRDADEVILATVNLVDRGSQRFSKKWLVISDNTINGKYISITTKVYSDSGYTTLSTIDGADSQTYLIQQRVSANQVFGGGGGVIDYREIAKIVAEEIKKIPKLEFPKQELPKALDLSSLIKEIVKVSEKIDKIKIPEPERPEKVNLRPLEKGIESLSKEIRNLPRFEKTDFSSLISELQNLNSTITETHKKSMKIIEENSKKNMEEIVAPLQKENAKLKTILSTGIGDMTEETQIKAKKDYLSKLRAKFGL